jgi:carbonic anhydrase/acetyltransferase-like protein (isoleucine patch superfamily)
MDASLRKNPAANLPQADPSSYVDPSAVVIGPVIIGKRCYIGPNAVVRADEVDPETGKVAPVTIGDGVNLQDGVIIHALAGCEVIIGSHSSLAHGCIVHGPCVLEEGCFVGFNAVVFKSVVGKGSMIKHGAVVEGVDIPAGKVVPTGAVITKPEDLGLLTEINHDQQEFMQEVAHTNEELAAGYKKV